MSEFIVPLEVCNETISHATLNSWHLAPRFVEFLEEVGHPSAKQSREILSDITATRDEIELTYFLQELEDILMAASPEGYMFSAHEGDGSDFGFWEVTED